MRLLLDSHTILWAIYEPENLPPRVASLLSDEDNELLVSHATVWEVGNKAAAHRLPLAGSDIPAIVQRMSEFGVTFLPLLLEHVVSAAMLPRHHDDPFDRVLVAQAQAYGLVLITRDRYIPLYDVKTLWN